MSVNTIRNKSMYFESFFIMRKYFCKNCAKLSNTIPSQSAKHSKNCKARMEGPKQANREKKI